jgi:lysophospholipid acyltransferase (LPLAT)-like uncharacterized protein
VTARRLPWWMGPGAWLGAQVLRALGGSWRMEGANTRDGRPLATEGPTLFALWHARLLPLIYAHRGQGVVVLISRHRDGELVARVVRHLGYAPARGSSTRGGEEGLREMLAGARRGVSLAVTVDGPRGPAERVKPGVAYMASRTGLAVTPVAACAASLRRLRSWDRFVVPLPFARVVVAYGAPIAVPPGLEPEALEPWRIRIERALAELTARTQAAAGEAP